MAILKLPADDLMNSVMGDRPNSVTLNAIAFDVITRTVALNIVGAEVPEADEVELKLNHGTNRWYLAAKEPEKKTEAEKNLLAAALHWRQIHGPATDRTSSAMKDVAFHAEAVIRERNRAAQTNEPPQVAVR